MRMLHSLFQSCQNCLQSNLTMRCSFGLDSLSGYAPFQTSDFSGLGDFQCIPGCKKSESVTAQSFAQAYNLANSNFQVQLASPNGKNVDYAHQDDSNRRWFNEFRAKANSTPIGLETIDPARYTALILPDSPGAAMDLHNNPDLKQILVHFVKERKPICAVGMGVAGLFSSMADDGWSFEEYSVTCTSLFELARSTDFPSLPIIPEDFVKDHGGKYSCSGEVDSVHVVIDRHLITGQNVQSTITAVQNLILMCSQKNAIQMIPISNKQMNDDYYESKLF